MPGINAYEFVILLVLAVVILGPERLPQYAQTLARWVRQVRGMAESAKEKFKDETGTDFDSVDWKRYDPRQYDPRRIIRDALTDDFGEEIGEVRGAIGSLNSSSSRRPATSRASARGSSAPSRPRSAQDASAAAGPAASNGRTAAGEQDQEEAPVSTPASAGTAGAARRSAQSSDPRDLFRRQNATTREGAGSIGTPSGGSATAVSEGSTSAERPAVRSALAAGAAGALVTGAASTAGAAQQDGGSIVRGRPAPMAGAEVEAEGRAAPAPFDIDAT